MNIPDPHQLPVDLQVLITSHVETPFQAIYSNLNRAVAAYPAGHDSAGVKRYFYVLPQQ